MRMKLVLLCENIHYHFITDLAHKLFRKDLSVFELIIQSHLYLIWTRQLWYDGKNASRLDCTCWKFLSTAGIHTVDTDRRNKTNDLTVAKSVESEWNQQRYTICALKQSLSSKWLSKILENGTLHSDLHPAAPTTSHHLTTNAIKPHILQLNHQQLSCGEILGMRGQFWVSKTASST